MLQILASPKFIQYFIDSVGMVHPFCGNGEVVVDCYFIDIPIIHYHSKLLFLKGICHPNRRTICWFRFTNYTLFLHFLNLFDNLLINALGIFIRFFVDWIFMLSLDDIFNGTCEGQIFSYFVLNVFSTLYTILFSTLHYTI